ncbi:MAG TPA: hypothetical protein VIY49_13370 [Bryobacteraceae bacterium]
MCLLAGLLVWGTHSLSASRADQEAALRLLTAFTSDDQISTKQAASEVDAQGRLFQARADVRSIFLQSALRNSTDLPRLFHREQSFSVSLSQVRSADAHALYEQAISPAIHDSNDPRVLREAFELMGRWNSADAMNITERDGLAGELAERMLKTEDPDLVHELSGGLEQVAPGMSPWIGEGIAWKLALRSTEEGARSTITDAQLPALLALERSLGTASAGQLAVKLIDRMFTEKDPAVQRTLAMEAKDPEGKISQAVAGEIATKVVDRMLPEAEPVRLAAWAMVLDSLKDVIEPAKAGELALRLEPALIVDLNRSDLTAVLSGWRGLAAKSPLKYSQQIGAMMAGIMPLPNLDAHALRRAATILAVVNANPSTFAPAGSILVSKMRAADEPNELAALGSGVAALRRKLPVSMVDDASAILITRMISTRDPDALEPMAGAIDDLDEGISKPKINEFVAALAGRMRTETSSKALLNLAVAFVALAQQSDSRNNNSLATTLLARMQNENGPQALRTLAFSLGTVADGANPAMHLAAGNKLAMSIAVENDADALRALTAGLCSLGKNAGAGNFEKAAFVLASRIRLEDDPGELRSLAESLRALSDFIGPAQIRSAALTFGDRILDAKDPAEVRSLARSLETILPNVDPDTTARLGSMFADRAAQEPNTDLARALGETLELLPAGSVPEASLGRLDRLFRIPDSPCGIVARVKQNGDLSRLVQQILNPACSQASWTQVVGALDDATNQAILHRGGLTALEGPSADFKQLVVADDDDAPDSAALAEPDRVDFNKLSQVLDGQRQKERLDASTLVAGAFSGLLALVGVILLLLAWRTGERGRLA